MAAHPLLEVDDFDELIDRAVAKAATWKARPLPADASARDALLSAVEADCKLWEALLMRVLAAISIEKAATEDVFAVGMTPSSLDFDDFRRLQIGPYVDHFATDEVAEYVKAIRNIWLLMKKLSDYKASRTAALGYVPELVSWMQETRLDKDEQRFRSVHRELHKWDRKVQTGLSYMLVQWHIRKNDLALLREFLTALREFFRPTNDLRERIKGAITKAADPADQIVIEESLERVRLEEQAKEAMLAYGLSAAMTEKLSDAQMTQVIWAWWKQSLGTASIRDKWNSEFPSFAVRPGKDGTAHIRGGVARGNFLINRLLRK